MNRKLPWTIGIGLLLIFLTLSLALIESGLRSRVAHRLPVLGSVADLSFTNQSGDVVSLASLHGTVWIADTIFTRCPGPCLRMTHQMKELQDLLAQDKAKLVSFTTDPEWDTPEVLRKYGRDAGADTNRWQFLTGSKATIASLAIDSLKFVLVEKGKDERESPNDLFIHSTKFAVIDRKGQLRAVFDTGGEGVEWAAEKKKILVTVKLLEREP